MHCRPFHVPAWMLILLLTAWGGSLVPVRGQSSRLSYIQRDTREATRKASLEATLKAAPAIPQSVWHTLGRTSDRSLAQSVKGGAFNLKLPIAGTNAQTMTWRPAPELKDGTWHTLALDTGWLYRTAIAETEQESTMILGADRLIKLFVNGVDLQTFATTLSMEDQVARFTVPLRQGTNHLLFWIGGAPIKFRCDLSSVGPGVLETLEQRLDTHFPQSSESRFYRIETVPVPRDIVLEVGGMDATHDGGLAVATRRGDLWILKGQRWHKFASGLHEPLGLLTSKSNEFFVLQRPELTRVSDQDNDGVAESFRTLADFWKLSGGHHEHAFGPVRDSKSNLWGVLSGLCDPSKASYCGWSFYVTPAMEFHPWSTGFRSPNGIGITPDDEIFVTDNQGEWVGTSPLHHVSQGAFHGHPVGLRWDPHFAGDPAKPDPVQLDKLRKPAAVLFPYGVMGQSLAQPLVDTTQGKFGPFAGQLFVADQSKCSVMRVALEKVRGEFQGACFPFRSGFQSGNNRLAFAADGSLYVGQTDRGWGSIGGRSYGLQRLVWSGELPLEIHRINLTHDGFTLAFTKPLDPAAAANPASYSIEHYHYLYHAAYGSPVVNRTPVKAAGVRLSEDRMQARLVLPELVPGRIYELNLSGLQAADGTMLLHPAAYYTLNRLL